MPDTPSSFSAITVRACLAPSACARGTNPARSLSFASTCAWVSPNSGASRWEARNGSLIRYGSAEIAWAGSDTARSTPLRSVIVPRWAGSVSVLSCWVWAALRSAGARTVPRYSTRAAASTSSKKNSPNMTPILCWTVATR